MYTACDVQGNQFSCDKYCHQQALQIEGKTFKCDFFAMQQMPVDVLLGGNFIDRYTPYGCTMKNIMFTLQGEKISTPRLVYATEKHPSVNMIQTTVPHEDLKALIIQNVCSDDP